MANNTESTTKIHLDKDIVCPYSAADLIIRLAKAFERSIYQGIYLLDYSTRKLLYMSDNLIRLSGGEVGEELNDLAFSPFINLIHESELKILHDVKEAFFNQLNVLPI